MRAIPSVTENRSETVGDALREGLALIIADLHGKGLSKVEVSIGGRHTITRRVQPQGTAKPPRLTPAKTPRVGQWVEAMS